MSASHKYRLPGPWKKEAWGNTAPRKVFQFRFPTPRSEKPHWHFPAVFKLCIAGGSGNLKFFGMLPLLLLLSAPIAAQENLSGTAQPEYRGRFTPDAEYVLSGGFEERLPQLPPMPDREVPGAEGFRPEMISKVPPPGTHPRVLLSPEDVDAIRKKIALGDKADSVFRRAFEELKLQAAGKSGMHDPMRSKAFLALVTNDEALGREAAAELAGRAAYLEPALDILNSHEGTKGFRDNWWYYTRTTVRAVGGTPYKDAFEKGQVKELAAKGVDFSDDPWDPSFLHAYDYAFMFMSDEQKALVRRVIGKLIGNRYAPLMALPGHMAVNFETGEGQDFLLLALAIEGEEGYDPRILQVYSARLRDKLAYDISPDGILYERARGFVPHLAVMAAGRRDPEILAHKRLRAYLYACAQDARKPYFSGKPQHAKRGNQELQVARSWRCGGGGATSHDNILACLWILKPLYPGDQVIDFLYKSRLKDNGLMPGPEGVFRGAWQFNNRRDMDLILAAACDGIRGGDGALIDYDGADAIPEPMRSTVQLDFKDIQRGVAVSRCGWDQDSAIVRFEARNETYFDGADSPDCGDFQLFSHGVSWSPWLGPDKSSYFRNMVLVDGLAGSSPPVSGRLIDAINSQYASTFVSDAADQYNWSLARGNFYLWHGLLKDGGLHVRGDSWTLAPYETARSWELPFQKASRAFFQGFAHLDWGACLGETRGPNFLVRRNDLVHVFRTLHLARGAKPYLLILDDIAKDGRPHRFDWLFNTGPDIVLCKADSAAPGSGKSGGALEPEGTDIILSVADLAPERFAAGGGFRGTYGATYSREPRKGAPMLLVRVLNCNSSSPYPLPCYEETDMEGAVAKRIRVTAFSADPSYKILIFPFLFGDALPRTEWSADRSKLNVTIDDVTDSYTFAKGEGGRTLLAMGRGGKPLCSTPAGPPQPVLDTAVGWAPEPGRESELRRILISGDTQVGFRPPPIGTVIRYTLDNSEPSESSTAYAQPFVVGRTCVLKAKTFAYHWPFQNGNSSETTAVSFEKMLPADPAAAPAQLRPGVACEMYEARKTIFDETSGFFTGVKSMLPNLDRRPLLRCRMDNFSVPSVEPKMPAAEMATGVYRFRGLFQAPQEGVYSLRVNSCGPVVLKIGGQGVISADGLYGLSQKDRFGQAVLKAGLQEIELVVCDPIFWKGRREEPYRIEVAVMPPDEKEYLPLRNSQIFTSETDLKPPEPPKIPAGKTVTAGKLLPGLVMKCYDRSLRLSDIPPDGLPLEMLTPEEGEKPYSVRPILDLEENNFAGRLMVCEGFLLINEGGTYEFRLDGKGANMLVVDGIEIASNRLNKSSPSRQINLEPGLHSFSLRMSKSLPICEVRLPGGNTFETLPSGIFARPADTEFFDDGRLIASIDCERLEGEKTDIVSTSGATAAVHGGETQDGKVGKCFKMKAWRSRMTLSNLAMPENELSLFYWCRIDRPKESAVIAAGPSKPHASMRKFKLNAEFFDGSESEVSCDLSDLGIKAGDWFNIALSFGDKLEIFINGEPRGSAPKPSKGRSIRLKEMTLFANFDGAVDNVRIFNKALDAAAVEGLIMSSK